MINAGCLGRCQGGGKGCRAGPDGWRLKHKLIRHGPWICSTSTLTFITDKIPEMGLYICPNRQHAHTHKNYICTDCPSGSVNFLELFENLFFCCLDSHIFSINNIDREWDVDKQRARLYLGSVWTVEVRFGQCQIQQIRDDPWKVTALTLTAGQGVWPPPRGGITEAHAAVRTKSSYTFINTHTPPISAMQLLLSLQTVWSPELFHSLSHQTPHGVTEAFSAKI